MPTAPYAENVEVEVEVEVESVKRGDDEHSPAVCTARISESEGGSVYTLNIGGTRQNVKHALITIINDLYQQQQTLEWQSHSVSGSVVVITRDSVCGFGVLLVEQLEGNSAQLTQIVELN